MDGRPKALVKNLHVLFKNVWIERKKGVELGKKIEEGAQGQTLLRGLMRYMYTFLVAVEGDDLSGTLVRSEHHEQD